MKRSKSPPSNELYAVARRTLEKAIRNPDKFAQALALAIRHCEKARAYEAEIRQLAREAKGSWGSANAAALARLTG